MNTKRTILTAMTMFCLSVITHAATIPVDGDAWTEDSTTGWASSGGVVAQSTDHMVGDYSITGGASTEGYPAITFDFPEPLDLSGLDKDGNYGAVLHFYWKIDYTGSAVYDRQLRLYSANGFIYTSEGAFGYRFGSMPWTDFEVPVLWFWNTYGTFDYTNVTKIMFLPNPMEGTTTQYIDGLNVVTVPEPSLMAIIGIGSIIGLVRRRNVKC